MQQSAIDGSVPVHDLRDGTVLGLQAHTLPELVKATLELGAIQHNLPVVFILIWGCGYTDLAPGSHVVQCVVRVGETLRQISPADAVHH